MTGSDLCLSGRVAIVSGAAGGIGASIAQSLVARGAGVVLADLRGEECDELAGALNEKHYSGRARGHPLDVTAPADWTALVRRTRRTFGHPTVLVNAAGVVDTRGLAGVPEDNWSQVVDVCQRGTWLGMRAVARSMDHSGGGAIVNLTSVLGLVGSGAAFAYQSAKGAVRSMTRAASVEFAGRGIRVNSVCPGMIDTPMSAELPADFTESVVAASPLRRWGTPEDVASAVLFLVSAESSFITGTELVVDGGYTARGSGP